MPLQVLVILAAVPTANHLTERYQSSKYREKNDLIQLKNYAYKKLQAIPIALSLTTRSQETSWAYFTVLRLEWTSNTVG